MLYCEDCRVAKKWNYPSTVPFHNHYVATCEVCRWNKDCYDYPAIYAKPKESWTQEEIMLDKRLQHEYHQKAESLIVAHATGRHAGSINPMFTEGLKNLTVGTNGEIDWYATYELRVKFQENYSKMEKRKTWQ